MANLESDLFFVPIHGRCWWSVGAVVDAGVDAGVGVGVGVGAGVV